MLLKKLTGCWFDKRGDRTAAMGKPPIRAVGVNPVALVFRLFETAGSNDAAAGTIRFQRARQGGLNIQADGGYQHFDHVVDGVVFVVEDDDVVELFEFSRWLCLYVFLDIWFEDGLQRHVDSLNEIGLDRIPPPYENLTSCRSISLPLSMTNLTSNPL